MKDTTYVCQACGANFSKWEGKCRGCGGWNTIVEERAPRGGKGSSRNIAVSRTGSKAVALDEAMQD